MANKAKDFWAKVGIGEQNDCWPWLGCMANRSGNSYGRTHRNGKPIGAHRVALELYLGRPISEGMCALHSCPGGDNKWCCNPHHLREGTYKQNLVEARERGDRTWNPRGSANPMHKLTQTDVDEIRSLWATGEWSQTELGRLYGIARSGVSLIVNRKRWV